MGIKYLEENEYWILGTLGVPPARGGSEGIHISLPNHLLDSGDISLLPNGHNHDNTSGLTAAGYVTEPHVDFYGCPQLVVHVHGRKLWLVWPASKKNLEAIAPYILSLPRSEKLNITRALQNFEGLQAYYCNKKDQSFVLEPYAIHAVISETVCAHRNKIFTHYSLFDSWYEAHRTLVMKSVSRIINEGYDPIETERIVNTLIDGKKTFRYWDSLLENRPNHDLADSTRQRLTALRDYVDGEITRFSEVSDDVKRKSKKQKRT
jgi:hypothetical protein